MSNVSIPNNGKKITMSDGKLNVPDNPIIPNILGAVYSALGDTEAAIEHYNKAIKS